MIEFKNISKTYNNKVKAVDSLNLTINDGEIFGFLGPNGAGKSTAIKMLVGILPPSEGDIIIDNYSIASQSVDAKKIMAYVPDEPKFYQKITGYEYLNFIADIYSVSEMRRKEIIEHYAAKFDLKDALRDKVSTYSHGMGQKLSIMAALVHSPKVLILDEPMVGLDPKSSRDVKEMMREHTKNGGIVFFSTHVLEVAQGICDRIAIIQKGKVIASGDVDELLAKANDSSLEDFFLSVTETKED